MKPKSFTSGLQMMLSAQMLVPFLLGTLALAVLGSAVYQVLTNWLGTQTQAAVQIGASSLLVLMVMAALLSYLAGRQRALPPLKNKSAPLQHKRLILLISSEALSRKAAQWHGATLERCWLFCSAESMPIASKLQAAMESQGKVADLELIKDVFDPLEYHTKVERIYSELPSGWSESDVILDFTGMTACASVGCVLACLNEQRPIQYTPGKFDAALKTMQPFDPVEVVLDWSVLRPPAGSHAESAANPPQKPVSADKRRKTSLDRH